MKPLVWLASYPKSGNTWVQIFLENYLANAQEPVNINLLPQVRSSSGRELLDTVFGVSSANFTFDEIDLIRPTAYRKIAQITVGTLFLKTHDAYRYLPDGQPAFPPDVSYGAIYIIRNPLDIVVSYAHFEDKSYQKIVHRMNKPDYQLAGDPDEAVPQVRQRLGTWSSHVQSWVNAPMPVHIMRYEDMLSDPVEAFHALLCFLGAAEDRERLERALRFSSFKELSSQETMHGFGERVVADAHFFRRGTVGEGKAKLEPEVIAQVVQQHGEVMKQFGYATE